MKAALLLGALLLASMAGVATDADTIPPTTLVQPGGIEGNNGWFRSDVTVRLDCVDNVECLKTEFSVDGSDFEPYADPFPVAGDGIHVVLARSTDKSSNVEPTNTLLVKIDTVAPEATLDDPAAGNIYVQDQAIDLPVDLPVTLVVGDKTVRASASDATSGVERVEFFLDGALRSTDTEAPYEWLWNAGNDAAGGHALEVVGWDVAGNNLGDALHVVTLPTSPDGVQATLG